MGNKLNPTGYRIGVSKDWSSHWFAGKKNFGDYVVQDAKVRNYLKTKLKKVGLEEVVIKRGAGTIEIIIKVAKPGMVIGKGGAGIQILSEDLKKIIKDPVSLKVEEVRFPETKAALIAQNISYQIERRVNYKFAINTAIQKAVERGVKGIRIHIGGVISGANSIARSENYSEGSIPLSTIRADIDFAKEIAITAYGVIGLKVWVYVKE